MKEDKLIIFCLFKSQLKSIQKIILIQIKKYANTCFLSFDKLNFNHQNLI